MKAMFKYPLDGGMNQVEIPGGLCGSSFGVQPGQPGMIQMWTLVDNTKPIEVVDIYVAGTGEPLPINQQYMTLGTVLLHGGAVVVHALLVH